MIKPTIKIEGIDQLGAEIKKEVEKEIAKEMKKNRSPEIETSHVGEYDPETGIVRGPSKGRKKK